MAQKTEKFFFFFFFYGRCITFFIKNKIPKLIFIIVFFQKSNIILEKSQKTIFWSMTIREGKGAPSHENE